MSQKPSFGARVFEWTGGHIGCAMYLGLAVGGAIGFGAGLLYAEGQIKQRQWHADRELLEPIVASDPAFAEVKLLARSIGGYDLIGVVLTQADHDRLRERVVRAFGENRGAEIVRPVMVRR
jgi:hypothetical protein